MVLVPNLGVRDQFPALGSLICRPAHSPLSGQLHSQCDGSMMFLDPFIEDSVIGPECLGNSKC